MKARIAITALVALLIFCAGYAALFIAPDEATMHAIQRIFYFHVASWNAMFSRLLRRLLRQRRLSRHRQTQMGLPRRLRRRSRRDVLHHRPDHRPALGASRLGHLVDLGRAPHLHLHPLAAVHLLPAAPRPGRRSRKERIPFRRLRNFRVSRYPARLSLESPLAHPASTACDCRRTGFGPRSHDWKSIAAFASSPNFA